MKTILSAFVFSCVVAAPVSAATITEGFSTNWGDDFATATDVGALDQGTNTVSGILERGVLGEDVVDTVKFTVAAGDELVGAAFSPSGLGGGQGPFPGPGGPTLPSFDVTITDLTFAAIASGTFGGGTGGAFLGGNVLAAGDYILQIVANTGRGELFDALYTVELDVEAGSTSPNVVPLPASAPLVLGGLALFGVMGWRKKRNA